MKISKEKLLEIIREQLEIGLRRTDSGGYEMYDPSLDDEEAISISHDPANRPEVRAKIEEYLGLDSQKDVDRFIRIHRDPISLILWHAQKQGEPLLSAWDDVAAYIDAMSDNNMLLKFRPFRQNKIAKKLIGESGGFRDYSDDEIEYTSRAGTLYDDLPGSEGSLGPRDDHLESITSQDMADAKRYAKSDLPRDQADYLDISVEDWHRIRQELDDHYEDRHMEDQMAFDDYDEDFGQELGGGMTSAEYMAALRRQWEEETGDRHPLDTDGDGNVDWDEISENKTKAPRRQLEKDVALDGDDDIVGEPPGMPEPTA